MATIVAAVMGFLRLVFGLVTGRKPATIVDLADSNARVQEQLSQRDDENAAISQAARTRADADARVLHVLAGRRGTPASDAAVNAEIRKQFPDEFAD